MYEKLNGLDKKFKPLIMKWLTELFDYQNYPYSFKDQWITWTVWDGQLSVGFDLRQEQHVKLISMIHPRFLGVPQYGTLKVVNTNNFYLELDKLLNIKYPEIVGSRLISTTKSRDNDGDICYSCDWEVLLDDATSIKYSNQSLKFNLKYDSYIYRATIQERAFTNFLLSRNY